MVKLRGGTCPKCESTNTTKEKIMGQDTMDIICLDCRYTGFWKEFHKDDEPKNDNNV